MKLHTWKLLDLVALVVAALFSGATTAAQQPDLGDLAKRLSKQISKAGINSVAVADFVSLGGESLPQGHYLAGELSESLDKHKKNFVVAARSQWSEVPSHAQLLPKDLSTPEYLQRIGSSLQVDAVVTGMLETTPAKYLLKTTLRSVKDGALLGSENQLVNRPAVADGIVEVASNAQPGEISVAGQDGVGVPKCKSCPPPRYSDQARRARLQGSVVLVVIVTAEGRATRIAVTKAPDPELAKQAIDAVKKWKFQPATDKGGKPVTVIVPIEVTFRLY